MGVILLKRFSVFCTALLIFTLCSYGLAATDGTVSFTVRTLNFNTSYDPNNIMAIWVVDSSGTFVKTLKKRASTRQEYLYRWIASSGQNTVDAVTGATLSNHQTHTVTWNCRDVSGTLVPDGTYYMRVEYTMANNQGPYTTNYCDFIKGASGYTQNYSTLNNRFTDMSLTYTPVVMAHDLAVLEISPLWVAPNSQVPLNVLVTNKGESAESFTVRLSNATENVLIGSSSVANLGVGAGVNVAFSWNTTGLEEGTYALTAIAGPVTDETVTSDNTLHETAHIRTEVNDMALENLLCASIVTPGQTVPVTVNAVNLGDSPASCTVTVRDETDLITIGSQVINNLAAHSTLPLSFSWNTTGRSLGYHDLIAAASTITGETDLLNNTNQLTIALSDDTVQTPLIASGGEWQYNDQGRDLHRAPWSSTDYYDGEWAAGTAPLGYGGDGEVTVLSYGSDANNKYPTYYFRKTFIAPSSPVDVVLQVRRDDGVIVYLNGTEVARANMPAGTPEYQTLASFTESGSGETTYHTYTVANPALIQPGVNVLAAEVHQASPNSSDVGFDARLTGLFPDITHSHDVALVSFSVDSAVLSGDRIQLLMRVANNGTAIESFSIQVHDLTESTLAGTVSVNNLVPGEVRAVSLDWQTFNDTNTTHSLEAVAGPVSEETNTSDNSLTAQLTVQSASFGSPGKQPVGSVGGYCTVVAVDDATAYVGEGASITAIDLGNPSQPMIYGRVQLPGIVQAVAANEEYIYAACGSRGLFIINAEDPSAMQVVRVLDTSGNACGLALTETHLFVADGVAGVRIVNISNPNNAVLAGAYHTEGPAQAVALQGDTLYVLDGHNGLLILNAASKTAPVLLGTCDRVALGTAMAVAGSYVYVTDGEGVLSGVDVSTPANPTVSSRIYLPGPAQSIAADESALFIPAGAAGLVIADISSPGVVISNTWPTSSDAVGIAISDSRAYLAAGFGGLHILDINSEFNPSSIASVGDGTRARGSAVSQGVLYLASGNSGVKIYSVTNATLPELLGVYTNSLNAVSVAVSDDTLYVADGLNGLRIADVSTPAAVVHQATYTSADLGVVRAVAVHGSTVVISDGYRIELVNVSAPGSPQLRSSFSTNVFIQEIALGASNIYAAAYAHGVLGFSYTGAGHMTYTGTIATPGNAAMGVALSGARIYIADDAAGWHLADASQVVQTRQLHLPARGVATDGSRLHVLDAQHGLHSYDITLRLSPVERDVLEPLANAMQLTANNKFVYVAQDDAGAAVINAASDDTDFDGLPDSLEQLIIDADTGDGLITLADVLPGDDFDGDFLSNFAEFVAGTDPVDPLSVFAVRSTQVSATGTFFLRWSSVSNRTYAVYRSVNPANGFTAVQTGIPATPPINMYTTTDNTTNAYYTIIIE